MKLKHAFLLAAFLIVLAAALAIAQRFRGETYVPDGVRTARQVQSHSSETPAWTNAPGFQKDVFTFVRIRYHTGSPWTTHGDWSTDCPDSDLNLSYRLQQMTSLKVDPDGRVLELTDPELFDYPWIYMVEPGGLTFSEEEIPILRRYLLNGGFLMVDDFWGDAEWDNFYREIRRVFPDREPEELPMEHPIFHCVFDLKLTKNQMQVPNFWTGEQSKDTGVTWERNHVGDTRTVHFKGLFDDKRRMMAFIAHNTDNGDGWEREGEFEYFFREFSEKKAYPLGINVVFYAMTH